MNCPTSKNLKNDKNFKTSVTPIAICTLLSTLACSFDVTSPDPSKTLWAQFNDLLNADSITSMLALAAFGMLYVWFWKNKSQRISIAQIIASLLFSLFTVIGTCLDTMDSLAFLTSSILTKIAAVVMLAGFAIAYYALLELLFHLLDCWHRKTRNGASDPNTSADSLLIFGKWDIDFGHAMLFMLICWLPYFLYFFPGGISADTSHQMAQFFGAGGLRLDNHFPYLTSLLYGGCFLLGNALTGTLETGILISVIAQALICASAFALIVVGLKNIIEATSETTSPDQCRYLALPWLPKAALLLFALLPLIPSYVLVVAKDTIHAPLVALFVLMTFSLVVRYRFGKRLGAIASVTLYAVVSLLVCLTRNNGAIIVIPTMIALLLYVRKVPVLAALTSVCIFFACWQLAILPAAGVAPGEIGEALSIPAQMTAAYTRAYPNSLDDADEAILEHVFDMPIDQISKDYDARLSDPIKCKFASTDSESIASFLTVCSHMFAKHPLTVVGATLNTTFGYWYPFRELSYYSENSPFSVPVDNAFGAVNTGWTDASGLAAWSDRVQPGMAIMKGFAILPGIALFYTPGIYFWLIVILIAYRFRTRTWRSVTLIVLCPLLFLEAVLIAAPCCSLRYTLPIICSLPILVYLLFAARNQFESESLHTR